MARAGMDQSRKYTDRTPFFGTIDPVGWSVLLPAPSHHLPPVELRGAFSVYDVDQDGYTARLHTSFYLPQAVPQLLSNARALRYITVAELKAVLLSTGEDVSDGDAQLMIDMVPLGENRSCPPLTLAGRR